METPALTVEERPLVAFLLQLLYAGDVAPHRLDEILDYLESMPPAVRLRADSPDLARYAIGAANRLDRLGRPPIDVVAPTLVR